MLEAGLDVLNGPELVVENQDSVLVAVNLKMVYSSPQSTRSLYIKEARVMSEDLKVFELRIDWIAEDWLGGHCQTLQGIVTSSGTLDTGADGC